MKKGTKITLAVLAILIAVAIGITVVLIASLFGGGSTKVASQVLLEADFEAVMVEALPDDAIAGLLMEDTPQLVDRVSALDRAAEDERVQGFIAHIGAAPMSLAQVQELRDAVLRFRAAGKPAIAWSETFGEFGPGNGAYYLATAFDEIHLLPSGDVNLTGFRFESMFLAGAFEKLGLEPRFDQRYEYKNAMNTFTETSYTEAHREAMQDIVDSFFNQMVRGIAEGRGMDEAAVRTLIDQGPFLGQGAVDAGLVDGLAYRDQVYDLARSKTSEEAKLLYLSSYLKSAGKPHKKGTGVAVIYGLGGIQRGSNQFDLLSGSSTLGSDTVAAAFRDAVDDDAIKAILFRVDCPGGSYVASDVVWREVARAREAGKPVVVSMSSVAGSGGYFIAMNADRIVAQPATITGSIGVLGGKFLTNELFDKLGISFDGVQTSEHADMYSTTEDYGPEEWAIFQAWLDRVYADFTGRVAEGRGLPLERVREIAKGRIWSGEDALEIGLVDALGGYHVALAQVREVAGLEADADLRLKRFPKAQTPWEQFFSDPPKSSDDRAAVAALQQILERLRPVVKTAERTGLLETHPGVLSVPPQLLPAEGSF